VFILLHLIFNLYAWNEHVQITKVILDSIELPHETVAYVPLETAFKKTKKQFSTDIKINKDYAFPLKLDEAKQKNISVKKLMAIYSDEPDWGLDRNLFGPEQYPELWNDDIKYIGQKEGIMSQGFRHMFFPGSWKISQPISSFQIPMRPIGEAISSFKKYWNLANTLYAEKQYYWAYRFLAWATHYIEDLFQPFHTRQLPSIHFIVLDRKYFIFPTLSVPKTAEMIGYYHFSYETWLAEEVRYENSPLRLALESSTPSPVTAEEVVSFSGNYASTIGKLSYRVFPEFDPNENKKAEDIVGKEAWWDELDEDDNMENLIQESGNLFQKMGSSVKALYSEFIKRNASLH
jgi:hypothetical protein